jgi:hypothetical protein
LFSEGNGRKGEPPEKKKIKKKEKVGSRSREEIGGEEGPLSPLLIMRTGGQIYIMRGRRPPLH